MGVVSVPSDIQLWLDALLVAVIQLKFPYGDGSEAMCCAQLLTQGLDKLMQPGQSNAAQLAAATISCIVHADMQRSQHSRSFDLLHPSADGHLDLVLTVVHSSLVVRL